MAVFLEMMKDRCFFPATDEKDYSQLCILHSHSIRQFPAKQLEKYRQTCAREDKSQATGSKTKLWLLPVMLTSTHIWISASPQLRGHMLAMSTHDGVKGQQAGMRHHGCKLNKVIALGGCKIMGSSLESSGKPRLTAKFNHIPLQVSDSIAPAGICFQLWPGSYLSTFRVPC